MSETIIKTKEFKKWTDGISAEYRHSQLKALINVNYEMLAFYYALGKEISNSSFKESYGSKFYDNLSKELIKNNSCVLTLSPNNLRYMERFYLLYKNTIQINPELGSKLYSIPWGHHRYIIDKCKNVEEALFYVDKVHENNWSSDELLNFLDANLYKREG